MLAVENFNGKIANWKGFVDLDNDSANRESNKEEKKASDK